MAAATIFLLGATGYLGSEFLALLAQHYPSYPVNAIVRNVTPARKDRLQAIHPKLSIIEGTLEDADLIVEQVQKADIVINIASSDHWPSVKGTLCGPCVAPCVELTLTHSHLGRIGEELGE